MVRADHVIQFSGGLRFRCRAFFRSVTVLMRGTANACEILCLCEPLVFGHNGGELRVPVSTNQPAFIKFGAGPQAIISARYGLSLERGETGSRGASNLKARVRQVACSALRLPFTLVPKLERSERPDEVCPKGGNGGCQQLAKRFGNERNVDYLHALSPLHLPRWRCRADRGERASTLRLQRSEISLKVTTFLREGGISKLGQII